MLLATAPEIVRFFAVIFAVRPLGWQTKGLFYVGDPNQVTASLYAERLKDVTIEEELAAETLKLPVKLP